MLYCKGHMPQLGPLIRFFGRLIDFFGAEGEKVMEIMAFYGEIEAIQE